MLGTVRAQYHLRQVFVFLNMYPLNRPEVMIAQADKRFDAAGNLIEEQAKEFIRQLLQNLTTWTRHLQKVQVEGRRSPKMRTNTMSERVIRITGLGSIFLALLLGLKVIYRTEQGSVWYSFLR